jgi:hypothetical protein
MNGELLSYVFFAGEFAQALIRLGRADAQRWLDEHPSNLWQLDPLSAWSQPPNGDTRVLDHSHRSRVRAVTPASELCTATPRQVRSGRLSARATPARPTAPGPCGPVVSPLKSESQIAPSAVSPPGTRLIVSDEGALSRFS